MLNFSRCLFIFLKTESLNTRTRKILNLTLGFELHGTEQIGQKCLALAELCGVLPCHCHNSQITWQLATYVFITMDFGYL